MNRGRELAKNTLILSVGTFLPKFAALISIPIITGRLTKTELGTYDLITTGVSLLLPVVTLQIHSAAFRFLIGCRDRDEDRKEVVSTLYAFLLPVCLIALLGLYFSLYRVRPLTRVLVALYFLVDILLIATQQVIRGLSQNKLYSLGTVLQSASNMLLVVLLVAVSDRGLTGVLLALIVSSAMALILLLVNGSVLSDMDIHAVSSERLKSMLRYSWPMIPNTLSLWVLNASDRFVLKTFLGLESIAIYAAANKIPQLFTSVLGTFVFAWQENASLTVGDKDSAEYYSQVFDHIFNILIGSMAVLIAFAPILFQLLIKGDYSEAYPHMVILFMAVFFSGISSFFGGIYVAHKLTKSVGITTITAAICNLLIDLLLIRVIGIYAASLSTLISYLFLSTYRMINVKHFQSISYHYKKMLLCILILAFMCAASWMNIALLRIINLIFGISVALFLNKEMIVSALGMINTRLRQ